MNYKKYVLSKFITLLSFEDGFFFKVVFEKKIKLTDTLISLNYKKYSPYKNPFFIKTMENKNLYIWFYKREIFSKIIIPEAYLFFTFLKESHPNSFFLIEGDDGYHVLIIQNRLLMNSYGLMEKDKNLISMEMVKYGLDSYQEIDKKEYLKVKEEALSNIGVQELYQWSSIDIDKEKLLPTLINSLAYPLAFLLFFIMGVELYHVNTVEKRLKKVKETYSEVKIKNDDIREKINIRNAKVEKWVTFIHDELPYIDTLAIFEKISKVFTNEKFIFIQLSIVGSKIKIEMESKEDFVKGLNLLGTIKELKSVTIKHNNRNRNRVSYEAIMISKGINL